MKRPVVLGGGSGSEPDDFRRIVEQSPEGIVIVDSVGTVVYANPAAATMLGRKLTELVGSRLGVSVGRVQPILLEVPRGLGGTGQVELAWTTSRWRGEAATRFTVRDVTSARRAEQALKRSQVRFRSLMEHLPDGVALHRRGRVFYVNPALGALLGYEADLTRFGRFLIDHVAGPDRDAARKLFGIDEGTAPVGEPAETRLLHKSGDAVTVEVRSILVQHDQLESTLTIVQDIRERQQVVARMMQLDRLAAIGTLAAGIGHEINNPMTFVLGNLELAQEQLGEMGAGARVSSEQLEELHVAVESALAGAGRVTEIVQDFRTFTRQERHQGHVIDVLETVRFAIKMAAHHTRHRARVVEDLRPVRKIEGDATRLGQVFLNLLVNAAHAIGEGAVQDNQIVVTARDDGDHVVVSVADSGTGVAPEVLERIFEPFYTTKLPGEGMGLGLAIALETVMAHGGTMDVDSALGEGTTFHVRLPVAAIAAAAATDDEEEGTPPELPDLGTGGGRVLVIDDEPRVGDLVRSALVPRYEVDATDDPVAALELLSAAAQPYDLVLCDLLMPSLSGMQLYETIATSRPEVAHRIVFITAGGSTPDSQAFARARGDRLLYKPLTVSALRRFVAVHMDRVWSSAASPPAGVSS